MAETRVGISGWRYGPWRGVFYPETLPQREELRFAGACFNSVEINGSFYSLQRPSSYRQWYEDVPGDFVFAVKGGRFITHMRKLKNVGEATANFLASGVLALEEKLGPVLWQLPPQLSFDAGVVETFVRGLPRDTGEAAGIARKHSSKLEGRAWVEFKEERRMRHAMEVRHESFVCGEFVEMMRAYGVAVVFADTAGRWPYVEDVTADFVYVRLHGAEELYVSGYTEGALDWWAERVKAWRAGGEPGDARRVGGRAKKVKGRDVYVYFDNDAKVYAPFDAMNLGRRVGIERDYERIKAEASATGRKKKLPARRGSAWAVRRKGEG